MGGQFERPTDVSNFGLTHVDQIKLLHGCQDTLLKEQVMLMDAEISYCPDCPDHKKLVRYGKRRSDYHDVFTDHKLTIGRQRCPDCGYEPGSTIRNILGHSMSADLLRLQAELGAN